MATLEFNKITSTERAANGVSALSDKPNETGLYGAGGLTAQQLKNWFDKFANLLADKFNALCDVFKGANGADVAQYIKLSNFGSYENMREVLTAIGDGTFANTMMAYASASAEEPSSLQSILNSMAEALSISITTENLTDYIIDNLTTDDATKALSAKQGKALKAIADLKIAISSIADNLTTDDATKVLSAKQGKKLNDEKIDKTSIADNLVTDDSTKVLSAKQGKALDDKKVEKYTTADGNYYAYAVFSGVQTKARINSEPFNGHLPLYGANGILKTGDPATDTDSSNEVANVKFVRGKISDRIGSLNVGLSMDSSTYKIKAILKEGNNIIAESDEIDLPLETLVTSLTYSNGNIIATLKNGTTTSIPITDVIEDSDFYYILMYKYIPWMLNIPTVSSDIDLILSNFSRMPVFGENFVLFLNKYIPTGNEDVVVDTFIAQCVVKQILLDNNDPNSMDSKARCRIEAIYSIKGNTGAKLLSQSLSSFDVNGNAVYEQTFDDGTTATFTAYTGKAGRALYAQTVLYVNPEDISVESQQLLIANYFSGNQVTVDHPLHVGEQFYAMFEYSNNSYLAVCEIVSLTSTQFTYRVVNYSSTKGIQGDKGDTGLTYTGGTRNISFVPQINNVYVGGDSSGAGDYASDFNRTPVVGEVYTKYYNYSGQNGVITYMVTQVITAINSSTGAVTASVSSDVNILTGAVPVSTTFVGTDANGGNIYSISFSNGTTATITAPKGEGSSIGLFNGKSIDRYIFNHRISVEQMEAYLSTLTYEDGASLLVDTTDGIGVYAIKLSDMDASGSGYAVAVVTVDPNEGMTVNEIVFVSQFSYANVGIAQYALDDENFTFSEAGWLGSGSYVFQSETQVDGNVETEVNAFVSSDNSFWNMVYDLVDEDITNAKNGVTALHTEIDSLVTANNLVGTAGLTYTYNDTNGTAVCTGSSVTGDIVIPAYVKNNGKLYKVTAIGQEAFKNDSYLTSVRCSKFVKTIDQKAFLGCSNLKSFTNGSSLNTNILSLQADDTLSIELQAFDGTAFKYIRLLGTKITLENKCFANCSSLKAVVDYTEWSSYSSYVFQNCTSLDSIKFFGWTTLYSQDFSGCTALRSLAINDDVEITYYNGMFASTTNLVLSIYHNKKNEGLSSTDKGYLSANGVTLKEYFPSIKKYIHHITITISGTSNFRKARMCIITSDAAAYASGTDVYNAINSDDDIFGVDGYAEESGLVGPVVEITKGTSQQMFGIKFVRYNSNGLEIVQTYSASSPVAASVTDHVVEL